MVAFAGVMFLVGVLACEMFFLQFAPIKGDMNHDGKLTITDLSILATKINDQK